MWFVTFVTIYVNQNENQLCQSQYQDTCVFIERKRDQKKLNVTSLSFTKLFKNFLKIVHKHLSQSYINIKNI